MVTYGLAQSRLERQIGRGHRMAREWSERHIRELIARRGNNNNGGGDNPGGGGDNPGGDGDVTSDIDWYNYMATGAFKMRRLPSGNNSVAEYIAYGPNERGIWPSNNKMIGFARINYSYPLEDGKYASFCLFDVDSLDVIIRIKGGVAKIKYGISFAGDFMDMENRKSIADEIAASGKEVYIGTYGFTGSSGAKTKEFFWCADNEGRHALQSNGIIVANAILRPIILSERLMGDYTIVCDADISVGTASDTLPNIDSEHFKPKGGT